MATTTRQTRPEVDRVLLGKSLSQVLTTDRSETAELRDSWPSPFAMAPERCLGRVGNGGPMFLCFGGLHGNEPSGVQALQRVLPRLQADDSGLCGTLVAFSGNRRALMAGERFLEEDLNRIWSQQRLEALRGGRPPLSGEEQEMAELAQLIQQLLDQAEGSVMAMDLHTTSGPGPAFLNVDDTLPNRELALEIPVTLVLGIEEELEGTLTHYLTELGVPNVGFEGGQHDDPRSVDRAEAAIWIALEAAGVLERGARPEVAAARQRLENHLGSRPRVVEVRHRHAIKPEDGFRMEPGFETLQEVKGGELLAQDSQGPVHSSINGLILMPLYQSQGEDGFFLVKPINLAWLRLSALTRRLRLERFLHWLPGVRRHPEQAGGFIVDRRYARFLAPELFHLLGFRRHGPLARRILMVRRADPGT